MWWERKGRGARGKGCKVAGVRGVNCSTSTVNGGVVGNNVVRRERVK